MTELLSKRFETFVSLENHDYNLIKKADDFFENYSLGYPNGSYEANFTLKQKHTSKEVFDENFKNPLYNLHHRRITGVVAKDENRVTLKFFLYSRNRRPNEKFVRITTHCAYMTYNFKKNCLYTGTLNGYHKKRKVKKSVKIVSFVNDIVNDLLGKYVSWFHFVFETLPEKTTVKNGFYDLLGMFIDNIPGVVYDTDKYSSKTIYKTILTKKNIKLSDNWSSFCGHYPQPKAKDYKKHGDRYLNVIMGINDFNGDKIRRVLHKVKNFNALVVKKAIRFFGKDYILGKSDEEIQTMFESTTLSEYLNMDFTSIHSKKERNCIFEIFKLVINDEISPNTFTDHFVFYNNLKNYENVKWTSTNYDEFREEHLNWTEMNEFYTKGTFKRIYSDKFESEVIKPIFTSNQTFYPVILKDSLEYNDESFIQSNCVKGYVKRPDALIISLRKDNPDSKERATIEFKISFDTVIELKRVQTLGRFNKQLTSEWDNILPILDERIDKLTYLFETPKIKCKIGYVEFVSDSKFIDNKITRSNRPLMRFFDSSDYSLEWEDKRVNNINDASLLLLEEF